jgi:hypothetical protein
MKSLLPLRLAFALAALPLVFLSEGRCFLTSAHSLRVTRRHHHSQENTVLGEKVSLFGGKILFSPPAEFVKMSDELVSKKYPELDVPRVAYSNAETTVSVLVGFAEERNLRPEQLPKFKDFFTSALEQAAPGINWIKKEFVEIDGRRWIHLEYISKREGSREVHNDAYITSLDNRILFFNFNSAVSEYEKFKEALQRSKESILVKGP